MKASRASHILYLMVLIVSSEAFSQSIWDKNHLAKVKESIHHPLYSSAYESLISEANHILNLDPLSVTQKEIIPPSGDKHDYTSLARYYWPDPSKPDGRPYINRDGISNPELEKYDRNRLGQMAGRVTTLSLAWYFSGDLKYAQKATTLIRTWFLNPDTRMNPNLNYAQVTPGRNNDKGRCYGVIDAYSFVEMLDGVQLLEKSEAFTQKDTELLKAWFVEFLNWVVTSDQGKEEAMQKNNHSVAYDAQVIAFALYVGNNELAKRYIAEFPAKRIFTQIEPDGRQPQELRRTLAFGYSQFNLHHMIDVILMGKKLGLHIENETSADGRSFFNAVDFLTPYVGKKVTDWPYQQISDWDGKQKEFIKDLYRIYSFNNLRNDYLKLFKNNQSKLKQTDRFYLLHYKISD